MGVNVSALVVDSHDPARVAAFWQAVLGVELVRYDVLGVLALRAPGVTFDFVRVGDDKVAKNRWHVDLATDDPVATVEQALELGATRADDVGVADEFTVLRDPEGNEFCVLHDGSTAAPWGPPA